MERRSAPDASQPEPYEIRDMRHALLTSTGDTIGHVVMQMECTSDATIVKVKNLTFESNDRQTFDLQNIVHYDGMIFLARDAPTAFWNQQLNYVVLPALRNLRDIGMLLHEFGHMDQGRDIDFKRECDARNIAKKLLNRNRLDWSCWTEMQRVVSLVEAIPTTRTGSMIDVSFLRLLRSNCAIGNKIRDTIDMLARNIDEWYVSSHGPRADRDVVERWNQKKSAAQRRLDNIMSSIDHELRTTLRVAIWNAERDASARAIAWAQQLSEAGLPLTSGGELESNLGTALAKYDPFQDQPTIPCASYDVHIK